MPFRLLRLSTVNFVYTDRVHYGEVQCTRTIPLLQLAFGFLPFVNPLLEFMSRPLLPNYK